MSRTGVYAFLSPEERSKIEAEVNHHVWEASRLRRLLNASSAVMRLPDELLAEVLTLYAETSREEWRLYGRWRGPTYGKFGRREWIRLAHVCHHWREVAQHTPRLWINVEVTDPESVANFVARSGNLPLHVSFVESQRMLYANPQALPDTASLWTPIFKVASRVRSLLMQSTQGLPAFSIDEALRPNEPSFSGLKTLKLEYSRASAKPWLPPFLHSPLPSLQTLTIQSLTFDTASLLLRSSLTSLVLKDMHISGRDDWSRFLESLRNMARLHDLTLENDHLSLPGYHQQLPLLSSGVVELPALRSLHITTRNLGLGAALILRNINFPGDVAVAMGESAHVEHYYIAEGPELTNPESILRGLEFRLSGNGTIPPPPSPLTLSLEGRHDGKGYFKAWPSILPFHTITTSPNTFSASSSITAALAAASSPAFAIDWRSWYGSIGHFVEHLRHAPSLGRVQVIALLLPPVDEDDDLPDAFSPDTIQSGLAHLHHVETAVVGGQAVKPFLTALQLQNGPGHVPPLFSALKTLHITGYSFDRSRVEWTSTGAVSKDDGFAIVRDGIVERAQTGFPVKTLVISGCWYLTKEGLQELGGLVEDLIWDGLGEAPQATRNYEENLS